MPKVEQHAIATVSTTREVKLDARLEKKLRTRLANYASIKEEMNALKSALDDEKAEIGKLREKTGEQSIQLDGFTVTQVRGVTNKLDKKKLITLGCAAAWIEEATVSKPKKPYELVTLPGEKKEDDDDE